MGGSGVERAREVIAQHGIDTVECLFADLYGTPRGKRLPASHFLKSMEKGFAIADICHVWDLHCFIIDTPSKPTRRVASVT